LLSGAKMCTPPARWLDLLQHPTYEAL